MISGADPPGEKLRMTPGINRHKRNVGRKSTQSPHGQHLPSLRSLRSFVVKNPRFSAMDSNLATLRRAEWKSEPPHVGGYELKAQ
jgi:hypothetical protein